MILNATWLHTFTTRSGSHSLASRLSRLQANLGMHGSVQLHDGIRPMRERTIERISCDARMQAIISDATEVFVRRSRQADVRAGSGPARVGSGISPGRIGQLVAVTVDFEDDAEGVLDVDHAKRFLVWKIRAHGHPLFAACGDDLL